MSWMASQLVSSKFQRNPNLTPVSSAIFPALELRAAANLFIESDLRPDAERTRNWANNMPEIPATSMITGSGAAHTHWQTLIRLRHAPLAARRHHALLFDRVIKSKRVRPSPRPNPPKQREETNPALTIQVAACERPNGGAPSLNL